ncbi:hypothetical protein [Methanobrevibacter curvatus]|uniref:Uncharacterized protein n=1 Tax=Methanobrevibacter curvatus TaxID=49547 RepID=A0A166APX7_9EURY|nr:hypothetical protein [Methanobrevibacter curvatus]KZX12321.1 hypothetical protein MBCUR_10780 [Methanobrevibacter curvatus]
MAKPIAPTPILYGKDANEFLDMTNKPPTEDEKKFIKEVKETFKDWSPLVEE